MPTYEYLCDTCGEHFDIYQSFTDDALTECPGVHADGTPTSCGGEGKVKKVYGNVGIAFKGSGFYKNDSRGSSDSSDSSSSSKDSGSTSSNSDSSSSSDSSSKKSDSTSSSSSTSSDSSSSSSSKDSGSTSSSKPSKSAKSST